MVVAGLVIETLPERAASVAARLYLHRGLKIQGDDGDRRLAAVWTGADGEEMERVAEEIIATDEDVLGIYPTFVGQDEE
jgi:nitrate reductase NapAB chaperone NapD